MQRRLLTTIHQVDEKADIEQQIGHHRTGEIACLLNMFVFHNGDLGDGQMQQSVAIRGTRTDAPDSLQQNTRFGRLFRRVTVQVKKVNQVYQTLQTREELFVEQEKKDDQLP